MFGIYKVRTLGPKSTPTDWTGVKYLLLHCDVSRSLLLFLIVVLRYILLLSPSNLGAPFFFYSSPLHKT